jgi:ubiquinone/menaquinone biosynthesis C-methylase UbiE
VRLPILSNTDKKLSQRILGFHQQNYRKSETHQVVTDPKSSYFQYSRYFAILRELEKISFENFLDVGCAEGMYLNASKKQNGCSVYGVDFSSVALKKTKLYAGQSDAFLACADVTRLPFKDGSFDLVLCSETLEHVVNDTLAMEEIARICKKSCLITVPCFHGIWSKTRFKPDTDCTSDSHLRKYMQSELRAKLRLNIKSVQIVDVSSWYLSTADIVLHACLGNDASSKISHFFSKFASIDYDLCRAGAHGHSFICICQKN